LDAVGPWRFAWRRIRRDRWTVAALIALGVVLVVSLCGGAIATRIIGHSGGKPFPYGATGTGMYIKPVGLWSHVADTTQTYGDAYGNIVPAPKATPTTLFVLGGDGSLGRDELIRFLDGGRTSLEVGLGAMLFALLIAIPLGAVAGYFGGIVDAAIARWTDTVMAFPMLLFLVFATVKLSHYLVGIHYSWVVPKGVVSEIILIGAFTSFYPLRLIRSQLMTLRSSEFVEAAQMVGATDTRILRKHLFPHLVPTLLVWGAIAVATDILLEVSLSFIGVGIDNATPTWGQMLSTAWGTLYTGRSTVPTIWLTLVPTFGLVVTVAALNQLSEGIRNALEPWGVRR